MNRILFFLTGIALALSASAQQPAAVVEGVQMPAWLERNEGGTARRSPLAVGTELRAGDAVKTGEGSRALVKLAEGSAVKVGENATLRITDIEAPREGTFRAALRVLEGAFRFTTDALAKVRKREVAITVATVTAGVRGTDLWGKSAGDRQTVCLIEGRIEVGAEGEAPVAMDQARQFYRREKGQTLPLGFVTPEQLGQWALETDIAPGTGAARRGGKWRLTLATADTQAAALAVYDRLRAQGYAAEIRPARAGETLVYRVRIGNLPSKDEAEALAARFRGQAGLEPKVSM